MRRRPRPGGFPEPVRANEQGGELSLDGPSIVGIVEDPGQHVLELRQHDLRRIGVQDAGLGLHDVRQRPEGRDLAVRGGPPDAPADQVGKLVGVAGEFPDQPALPQPRIAHDRDHPRPSLRPRTISKSRRRSLELHRSAGEGCAQRVGRFHADAGERFERPPDAHRVRLPLHRVTGGSSSHRNCDRWLGRWSRRRRSSPGGAVVCSRDAMFTTSPVTRSPTAVRGPPTPSLRRWRSRSGPQLTHRVGGVQRVHLVEDAQPRAEGALRRRPRGSSACRTPRRRRRWRTCRRCRRSSRVSVADDRGTTAGWRRCLRGPRGRTAPRTPRCRRTAR